MVVLVQPRHSIICISSKEGWCGKSHTLPYPGYTTDFRLESLKRGVWGHSSCDREKRKYTKRNNEYWNEGGIQQVRKRAWESSSSHEPEP